MIRWLALLLWPIAALCFLTAPARADVGGSVPGPGLCDYPAIGYSQMIMSTYVYVCDFPVEVNGSHHHCEYGGGAVTGTVGVSIFMINAGISGNIGALVGSCSWRCPDATLAAAPNPPGGWKNYMNPTKCVSVGPAPPSPWAPPPPDEPPPPDAPPPNDQPPPLPPWQPGLNPGTQTNPGALPSIPQEPGK